MFGAELGREAGDELGAFELIDPFLDGLGEIRLGTASSGEFAGCAKLLGGFGAHACEDVVAVEAQEVELLIHEDDGGDAIAATDLHLVRKFNAFVTIDDAKIDFALGGLGDVVHDGHLLSAVTTPRATDDEDRLVACE